MRMLRGLFLAVAFLPLGNVRCPGAEEVRLLSLTHNGVLSWTNSVATGAYRVEWAPTVEGPWSDSWAALTNVPPNGTVLQVAVPMFYRVVYTPPPAPLLSNVTAAVALSLITNRVTEPGFVVLDVRTPGEYSTRHVKGAVNLDFYAPDFSARLAALDRTKAYLVYCASGNRSGQVVNRMRPLAFAEVYNLTVGFSSLAALPGAAPWLEP